MSSKSGSLSAIRLGKVPRFKQAASVPWITGATTRGILEAVAKIRSDIPIVTMGYYNPVLRFGLSEFARASASAGAAATIIQDLVPDEADEWCRASAAAGLDTIFLVAPTSTEHRIQEVADRTTGFVYAVSRTGVTGAESQVPPEVRGLVERIKSRTDKPVCVGFGISKPEHVRMVCEVADGAVIGSYLVNLLHQEWQGGKGRERVVSAIRLLKDATLANS